MDSLTRLFHSPPATVAAAPPDCLVIGSGTAGVTAALALVAEGHRVAILEAGPFVLAEHVGSGPFAKQHAVVPQLHDLVRHRTVWTDTAHATEAAAGTLEGNNNAWLAVGGRTLFWGGCTPRFLDGDFADWPYDAASFRPWYERAEALIGASGAGVGGTEDATAPDFIGSSAQTRLLARLIGAGIQAGAPPLGVDTRPVRNGALSRGFDSSVARLLRCPQLGRAADRAPLTLSTECAAIGLRRDGSRIVGVRVQDRRDGSLHDIAARHVVLAGGAVQSTRLCLASGLQELDPLVGHWVGDHLFVQAVMRLPEPLGHHAAYAFIPPRPDRPFHVQMQGMFGETWYSPLDATMWLDGEPDGRYLLYYCFGISRATREAHVAVSEAPAADPLHRYYVVAERTPEDLATLDAMERFTGEVATAIGAELSRMQRHHAGAALHEFGGLRMGRTAANSVTDPDGRFWRIDNLSCMDAAIWPHQGSANSYLTITATALRNAAALSAALREAP
ncbi:MAG: GMC family oxidoreductase [Rhodospirillales bacterium]|nr:GMC family oxidoreductase [Rhodospirillales bacterium]